jgi:hypothetical protein
MSEQINDNGINRLRWLLQEQIVIKCQETDRANKQQWN